MFKLISLVCIAISFNTSISFANSTLLFTKQESRTVAANMDWKYREGTVVIHPRHKSMVSSLVDSTAKPMKWKSRYASVMLHAGNRFKPGPGANGMNEQGLIASVLVLKASKYTQNNSLPALNTADWVQYVLDNFQSVQEVIDDSANYRLVAKDYRGTSMNLHMILHDAAGNSAVIESIDGRFVIHAQENFNTPVLTNSVYETTTARLGKYRDFGGTMKTPGGYDSDSRFVRASIYIKRLPSFVANEEHIAYAFNGLSDVAQAPGSATPTQLSVVYDIATKTAYFRSINDSNLRIIPLTHFDIAGAYDPLTLNPYQHLSGDVVKKFANLKDLTK